MKISSRKSSASQRSLNLTRFALLLLSASLMNSTAAAGKVSVPAGCDTQLNPLLDSGAVRIVSSDEESILLEVDENSLDAAKAIPGAAVRPELDRVRLRRRTIDFGNSAAKTAADSAQNRRLQIVKLAGPPTEADRKALNDGGYAVLAYLPENAYLVWQKVTGGAKGAATDAPSCVENQAVYTPADAIHPALDPKCQSCELVTVTVTLYDDGDQCIRDVEWIAGNPEIETLRAPVFRQHGPGAVNISLQLPGDQIESLAALETVVNIEEMSPGIELLGEAANATMAGATKFLPDGSEAPQTPLQDGFDYLDFLEQRLWAPFDGDKDPDRYPMVVIFDNGVDEGGESDSTAVPSPVVPDFYEFGDTDNESRLKFSFRYDWAGNNNDPNNPYIPGDSSTYPGIDTVNDRTLIHGTQVASVLAGYNDLSGPANEHVDSSFETDTGFQYGLGISPYGRIGSVKLDTLPLPFGGDPSFEGIDLFFAAAYAYQEAQQINIADFANPTLITSSSFLVLRPTPPCGTIEYDNNPTGTFYDQYAREYDYMTRDTLKEDWFPFTGLNQVLYVVAAGNFGVKYLGDPPGTCRADSDCIFAIPALNTITSPGVAKNALTAGGVEGNDFRIAPDFCPPFQGDVCIETDFFDRANNVDDVWRFSSKGTGEPGARIKPDLLAPAEAVYANAYWLTDAFTCGVLERDGVAESSTPRFYTRWGGTSASAPLIAGSAQLSTFFIQRNYGVLFPKPALLKAYLINTGHLVRGAHSGPYDEVTGTWDTAPLPSPYQGFGRVDLGMALESTPRYLHNQWKRFRHNGEKFTVRGHVADPGKPVRATLVWTDPTNPLATPELWHELSNNLDLMVKTTTFGGGPPTRRYYVGNAFSPVDGEEDLSEELYTATNNAPPVIPADAWDDKNNVECVFLEPQASGCEIEVTVKATSITEEGVYLDADWLPGKRQDFALVVYNFVKD